MENKKARDYCSGGEDLANSNIWKLVWWVIIGYPSFRRTGDTYVNAIHTPLPPNFLLGNISKLQESCKVGSDH